MTAVEAARRIAAGETGTPLRPLAASVATLEWWTRYGARSASTFLEESAPGVPR